MLVFGTQGLFFYLIGVLAHVWWLFAALGRPLLGWYSMSQEALALAHPYVDKYTTPVISPVPTNRVGRLLGEQGVASDTAGLELIRQAGSRQHRAIRV